MSGVWIFAENREQSLELLNIGGELASQIGTKLVNIILGDNGQAQDYIDYGADEVWLLPALGPDQTLLAYAPVIADEAKQEDPDIFLVAGTLRGKELAAIIASSLDTGLASDCTFLKLGADNKLEMERLIFGGAGIQKVVCSTRPQMATIPARTFEPAEMKAGREGIKRELPTPPLSPLKLLARQNRVRESGDIREAQAVVAVGRGIEKKEDIDMIRELADILGGEIGCTRPITEEKHWLPEDLCIGISALEVKPQLYIGIGVSGQIQHVAGFRDARIVCAINKDENAPIFEASDYGIVGDLYEVIPRLLAELKKSGRAN
ncbi:MAG: electron transfer flavoprotein subunit alpha/FixB family protein [Syntrophomonas sp.]|nr:electron transfer flavoprotein subunit alpha/FixB family protein [Syntrophomonas sp.]